MVSVVFAAGLVLSELLLEEAGQRQKRKSRRQVQQVAHGGVEKCLRGEEDQQRGACQRDGNPKNFLLLFESRQNKKRRADQNACDAFGKIVIDAALGVRPSLAVTRAWA